MFSLVRSFGSLVILVASVANAQILHTEDLSLILDSTRTIKGTFLPELEFRNLKEDLIHFENRADLSIRAGRSAFTFANKFELTRFGSETQVSGGFVYGEFRSRNERKSILEYYAQVHWAEARGLDRKYAGGVNFRWRFFADERKGLFAGIGPFYEYEKWNHIGVSDPERIPEGAPPVETELWKIGAYVSFKYAPTDRVFIDLSAYYQSRIDAPFDDARLASSSRITYNFTRHLGLTLVYQNIYDPKPKVAIDEVYNDLKLGASINF